MVSATIHPTELHALRGQKQGLLLIDVRTPGEFSRVHADGARLMPLDRLDADAVRGACAGDAPVYLLCQSGARAAQAARKLGAAGVDAVVVEGGTSAWKSEGRPVKRGRQVISLERQVRIGAGILVLTGLLLGWFVHPGFLFLSALVGAGLVFAGVTGACGMAFVLGKMPWNQAWVDPAEMLCPTPATAPAGAPATS